MRETEPTDLLRHVQFRVGCVRVLFDFGVVTMGCDESCERCDGDESDRDGAAVTRETRHGGACSASASRCLRCP